MHLLEVLWSERVVKQLIKCITAKCNVFICVCVKVKEIKAAAQEKPGLNKRKRDATSAF